MSGKGSRRRPARVTPKEWSTNWDKAFSEAKKPATAGPRHNDESAGSAIAHAKARDRTDGDVELYTAVYDSPRTTNDPEGVIHSKGVRR